MEMACVTSEIFVARRVQSPRNSRICGLYLFLHVKRVAAVDYALAEEEEEEEEG